MQQIELELAGGGVLTVSLRASLDAMPAVKQRPLVLVVPGGGYNHVSPREGDPVALQFAAAGYHTAVLTYSVGEGAQNYRPLRQLNEALALLRQNAGEWHILPDKIAVCGFSAGGHLALSQCSDPGLPGHHGRGVCPPGQLRPAGGRRGCCRTAGVHLGG